MSTRTSLFISLIGIALALGAFHGLQATLTGDWFALGVHPEVMELLDSSLEDQKTLAEAYPAEATTYRARFDSIHSTVGHLRVLSLSRTALVRRYEFLVLGLLGIVLVAGTTVHLLGQRRQEKRLASLRSHLAKLSDGSTDIEIGDQKRDVIGRIARMIESTSRLIAADRRRIATLDNLALWQEAARRHAHELKTPLTSATLELRRLKDSHDDDLAIHVDGILVDLDRLGELASAFTSFARLPEPRLQCLDLGDWATNFCCTFSQSWPSLVLSANRSAPTWTNADPSMLRQVLTNLCDNAALSGKATTLKIDVAADLRRGLGIMTITDDGPGVPPEIRDRLFEPYVSTRAAGEGMGLGLAIAKKIALDHGGDLLLERTGGGTSFRLELPLVEEHASTGES